MPTRLPMCRLVAVGSKPWYRVTEPRVERAPQGGLVRHLGDEAALAQDIQDVGCRRRRHHVLPHLKRRSGAVSRSWPKMAFGTMAWIPRV